MNDLTTREPANDAQDLERLLVARENAGDAAGMTALREFGRNDLHPLAQAPSAF